MSKTDKRVQKWLDDPPVDAPFEQVEAVLKRYFQNGIRRKGSHITVTDKRLIGMMEFGLSGDFQICVRGGQRVIQVYLKRLANAVQIINSLENSEHEKWS